MPDLWSELLACLDLRQRPTSPSPGAADTRPGAGGRRRETLTVYEGSSQRLDHGWLYGGQLLAQIVRAAMCACPAKAVKSLHVVSAHEGKGDAPVFYIVQRQHEGRSFAALTVTARQKRDIVATAVVSMHAHEDGPEHQTVPDIPEVPGPRHHTEVPILPWETRSTADLNSTGTHPPDYELWMRTPRVADEFGAALAAYATDSSPIGTALRPLKGVGQSGNGTAFTSATTTHSVWFHRAFRTDDWLLLRHHSPLVAHGRCFGKGDILTQDGTLVASFAQEGLLRFRP
ncbi:thioesterase family protein [Nocardia abscessus]|uniref:acyl-CoA thioesterase n=1 Tax=Nocardia abscessus TaxID=120957 RepID=UPI001894D7F6|nr:acyl-CoA thioesterase domain-containing protein [Nocardia abscessus]MBF6341464.1 thioesterase family protein [Nocardia abscessus]